MLLFRVSGLFERAGSWHFGCSRLGGKLWKDSGRTERFRKGSCIYMVYLLSGRHMQVIRSKNDWPNYLIILRR
jgi:hypothetical protein